MIPARPVPDEVKIPVADKELLSYVVAFGVPHHVAYARWHPEMTDASGKLNRAGKQACTHFFSYNKNREYMDAYRKTLEDAVRVKGEGWRAEGADVDDSRKDRALKSLLNQAMSMVESGDTLDPDTLKVLTEIFKKLGILKDEVEQEVRPIRFLPERCRQGCRYRLFVETAVVEGAMVDECRYCRALAYANERGYRDDETCRLEIPREVLDAEPDTGVRTLDIVAGKVEN